MEQVNIKTPEHVSLQYKLAGLGSRATAQIVDTLLIAILYAGMSLLVSWTDNENMAPLSETLAMVVMGIVIVLVFLIYWGYFFLFELFMGGQTPGKKLMGVRVIHDNGQSATALSLLIRNLLRIVDMLPAYYFVGMVMIFFHKQHKRLGDIVGGTLVVHERKKQKKKKKLTPLEKEIEQKGISTSDLAVDHWTLKQLTSKDWNLIQTYAARLPELKGVERKELTKEVASILLPKLGVEPEQQAEAALENQLLALYLHMKDEWDISI
ncbi:RDD family protein [Pontibacillus salicampi]|uniref:RDD family protein n=1 Tax=Pontibacillus salicampi TaxID=1449801 RepID=A0ABV6LUG4_9BACI